MSYAIDKKYNALIRAVMLEVWWWYFARNAQRILKLESEYVDQLWQRFNKAEDEKANSTLSWEEFRIIISATELIIWELWVEEFSTITWIDFEEAKTQLAELKKLAS